MGGGHIEGINSELKKINGKAKLRLTPPLASQHFGIFLSNFKVSHRLTHSG